MTSDGLTFAAMTRIRVATLLNEGRSEKEIASAIGLSLMAVQEYMREVRALQATTGQYLPDDPELAALDLSSPVITYRLTPDELERVLRHEITPAQVIAERGKTNVNGTAHPPEVKAQAREMWENGRPLMEIAQALQLPRGTVGGWASHHGWSRPEGYTHTPAREDQRSDGHLPGPKAETDGRAPTVKSKRAAYLELHDLARDVERSDEESPVAKTLAERVRAIADQVLLGADTEETEVEA